MRSLLILFLTAELAFPQTVLLQAPTADRLEYRSALKAKSDSRSPSQTYVTQHPSKPNRRRLVDLFTQAQDAYLNGDQDQARADFRAVVEMAGEEDWQASDRGLLLHASLRLAQLAPSVKEQRAWLVRALAFGDDLKPERDLFPPPLMEDLERLRTSRPRVTIPEYLAADWPLILIHGQPCRANACAQREIDEPVRVTFVSDIWLPQTRLMKTSEIPRFKPRQDAFVSGDCGSERLHPASEAFNERAVFFSLACEETRLHSLSLKPAPPVNALIVPAQAPPKTRFYESKWFWAGVGVVAMALIVNANRREDRREPTTTYGN